MDGTSDNTILHQRRQKTQGRRMGALLILVVAAAGLHVALFAALDAIAPLGADNNSGSLLLMQVDRQSQIMDVQSPDVARVIADAR